MPHDPRNTGRSPSVAIATLLLATCLVAALGLLPGMARADNLYDTTLTSSWGRPDWDLTAPVAGYFPQDMIMGTAYGAYPAGTGRAWRIRPSRPTLQVAGAFVEGSYTTHDSAFHAYVAARALSGEQLTVFDGQARGTAVLQARVTQPVDWVDVGLWTTLASNQTVLDAGLVRLAFAVVTLRDLADPTIALPQQPDPAHWYGPGCIPIHVVLADAGSGIAAGGMDDLTNGSGLATWSVPPMGNTLEPGATSFDGSGCFGDGMVDGANVLRVQARDVSGRTATSELVVRVDHAPPTIASAVATGATFDLPRPTLAADVADAHSGIASVAATIDGTPVTVAMAGARATAPLEHGLPPGSHVLRWTVTDVAGNAATSTVDFTVRDVTPPTLVLAAGADSGPPTTTVVARATDEVDGSGIDPESWSIRVDGAAVAVLGAATGVQATLGPLPLGPHAIEVRVADRSGNSAVVTRSYSVLDDQRDTVASTPTGGGGVATAVRLTGGHSGLVLLRGLPSSVAYGQTVRLDVQAIGNGEALAGRRMLVDVDGAESSVAVTDVSGIATVALDVRRSGAVRVQVPGTALSRVVGHLAVAPIVRIRTSTRMPKVGTAVRLSGSVAPVGSVRIVFLEARIGTAWFPLRRSIRVGRDGRFTTTVRSAAPGPIGVRVRTSSARGWAASTSNPVTMRVRR